MSKRTIVLGGAGLIGSHLCLQLLKDGNEVICIDSRSRKESPLLRKIENRERFHYIKHDITTPFEIGCDELYNLTSPIEFGDNFDYIGSQRLMSLGVINTLNPIIGSKTKVLYGSSDDIYNFERLDVNYKSNKRYIADARRFGESLHRAYNSKHKIDVRIARIFSTYGSNSGLRDQHIIGKMIIQALNNQNIAIYGNGEQLRTFCWVDDIVNGLIRLMRVHNNNSVITADLGSSVQISVRHLAELIISLTGSSSSIHHLPQRIEEPRYKIPNLKVAQEQLNWNDTTLLREGLQRTISYIEKELSTIAVSQLSWVEIYG